jgi:glycosyltransferase involved in cell wall biosynthesis
LADAIYLTQDGITDHIGQAQVAPYILGLARRGHRIHVVSAEKPGREALIKRYRELFDAAGIRWSTVPYANKPPLVSSFVVLWRMYVLARAIMRREGQRIIHCRAYLPLELAVRLKAEFGAKLIVDFRDFWADVGIEKKPFKFVYRHLKRREPHYICAADEIVTLTDAAADILMGWYPEAVGGNRARYHTIPCCADFEHFDQSRIDPDVVARHRRELDLGQGPVLLYLGSIGHDYLVPEMFRLFAALQRLRPDAKFLFLTNNKAEDVEQARLAAGVQREAVRFASVDRLQVPEFLALADLSVVFIRATQSKAGCSPTKLAELFACGVPVIANRGVGDMDQIIDLERNGSVIVDDFSEPTLTAALEKVLSVTAVQRDGIRPNSLQFSLEEGVRRYDTIYRLLERDPALAEAA